MIAWWINQTEIFARSSPSNRGLHNSTHGPYLLGQDKLNPLETEGARKGISAIETFMARAHRNIIPYQLASSSNHRRMHCRIFRLAWHFVQRYPSGSYGYLDEFEHFLQNSEELKKLSSRNASHLSSYSLNWTNERGWAGLWLRIFESQVLLVQYSRKGKEY